jgi:hypothetical protein
VKALLALFAVLLGADDAASASGFDLSTTDATPITAPAHVWTWIDLPGNFCDDGSVTGIGVNPGAADKLVVYMEGGGACGDYASCYQINSATHGPFGSLQFDAIVASLATGGSGFDRNDPRNPFAEWSYVYIPYCTGDVHSGDRVATYSLLADVRSYHHVGHTNAMNALDRFAATWPSLSRLVVAGSSAGGYGATINYSSFRARWPQATAYLVDDSGPLLADDVTPQYLKDWFQQWGVFDWVGTVCAGCTLSLTSLYAQLAARFPTDRMALLSSLQDAVISTFYGMAGLQFQAAVSQLGDTVLEPLPRFRHFYVAGATHTMLRGPALFSAGGVDLWTWLGQMIGDDPAWQTRVP